MCSAGKDLQLDIRKSETVEKSLRLASLPIFHDQSQERF